MIQQFEIIELFTFTIFIFIFSHRIFYSNTASTIASTIFIVGLLSLGYLRIRYEFVLEASLDF